MEGAPTYKKRSLVGRTIARVEKAEFGDSGDDVVLLVLDDGTKLYPSADEEGNGPGKLVAEWKDKAGKQCTWIY